MKKENCRIENEVMFCGGVDTISNDTLDKIDKFTAKQNEEESKLLEESYWEFDSYKKDMSERDAFKSAVRYFMNRKFKRNLTKNKKAG